MGTDDTITLNAVALLNDEVLTLDGASKILVDNLVGNINASSLTGELDVDAADNIADGAISISTGSNNTTISGGAANDAIEIDAEVLDAGKTLTTDGAVNSTTYIANLAANLINSMSSQITAYLDRDSLAAGTATTTITSSTAISIDADGVAGEGFADDDTITLAGVGAKTVTDLTANVVIANSATTATHNITLGDNVIDNQIHFTLDADNTGHITLGGGAADDTIFINSIAASGQNLYVAGGGLLTAVDVTVTSSDNIINTGAADDKVRIGTGSYTGTIALGAGNNQVFVDDGANTVAATISATGQWDFVIDPADQDAAITIDADQLVVIGGSDPANTIVADGNDNTITVDTNSGALVSYLLDVDVENWTIGVTGGQNNSVTLGSATQDVTFGAGNDTLNIADLTIIGTYALGAGANTITLTDGDSGDFANANTVGATISATGGSWKFSLDEQGSTLTVSSDQLVAISGSQAATDIVGGTFNQNEVKVDTTSGALTGYTLDGGVKYWNVGWLIGDGDNSVTSGADAQEVIFGDGNDTIKFTASEFDAADTVYGELGADTIEITTDANGMSTVVDSDFDMIYSVETLLLSGTGAQNATLADTHAGLAGILTVTAIAGNASTINIGAMSTGVVVSTNLGNDTITAGSGADNISTGDDADVIKFLSANFTASDTVAGADGADTIEITDIATVDDADFNNVTFVETLLLSGSGAQDVNFTGTVAQAAGVRTITATAGTASNIDISGTTAGITVATNAGNDTITAGSGNDSISTGDAADTIVLSTNLTAEDTIDGGDGIDTLTFTDDATGTDELDNVTNVEVITLGDASTRVVTQDTLVANGATLSVSAAALTGSNTLYWDGALESDGKFSITGSDQNDEITGGAGADTISSGSGNDLIITGNGSDSIIAGNGDDTVTVGTGSTLTTVDANVTVNLGTGADTIYIEIDDMTSGDTIDGGGDSDTMTLLTAGTLTDADLTNVTNIETLRLANGTNVITLSDEAYNGGAGFDSIVGGTGDDRVTITGLDDLERSDLTVNFSSGGQDTIVIVNDGTLTGIGQVASAGTLNGTVSAWNATGAVGGDNVGPNTAITIIGFNGGDNGDRIDITSAIGNSIGSYAENVKLTTNNLSGLSTNSVIEISSNTSDGGFQLSNPLNLGAVATQLDQLNNLQDGTYFIIVYNGSGSGADAYMYRATATEGDGLDFADFNGGTNGNDQDTLELIAQFVDVGGDVLNSSNFI
jgi:hypothetical protein